MFYGLEFIALKIKKFKKWITFMQQYLRKGYIFFVI